MVEGSHHERLRHAASTARDLLAHSKTDRWELFAKASVTREVEVVPDTAPRELRVEEMGVAVRTVRDGRAGFAAASGLESNASRRAIEGAFSSEVRLDFDPLPPQRLLATVEVPPPDPLPPRGWASHTADQLGRALTTFSDGRLGLRRTILQEGSFAWLLTTTEGFVATHDGTATSLLAEVQPLDSQSGIWREWVHVPETGAFDPASIAERIANRALLVRGQITTDSGLHDLILAPEVTAALLAALAPLFAVTPSDNDPLPRLLDKHGQLASAALTVVDDRTDPQAPITGPCDGEGLPARRTLLLDEGIPRHRLSSFRDAIALDEQPRGGALRLSYRDYPATAIANLRVITTDGLPPAQLLASAKRALYLLRPLAPIVCDPSTDSYRIVASGVWLRGHQVSGWHPVVELGGSIARLLQRIEAVGTDLAWFQGERGCVGAPSMLVRRQPVVR